MLPTWNHLWFLPYLFTYTLLLWAALRAWPQALDRLAARAGTWLAGAGLLLWPVLYLVLMRMALQGRFPVTHALVDDPFAHTQYLAAFVLGAVLARSGEVWPRMQRWRWVALGLAAAAWAVLVFADPSPSTLPWRRLAYGVQQWAAIVAAVGFAHRHLNQDGPWRRYLTEAVFPVYILHQTLIVLGATALAPAGLRPAVEGPLLVVGALVAGGLGFETVRRVRWLRPCFGLDRDPPASAGSRASRAISVP